MVHSSFVYTVEPVYYGHLGTSQKCPDYQGVLIFQVSLHDNVSFGTTARCVDYAGVHIFKCPPLYCLSHMNCIYIMHSYEQSGNIHGSMCLNCITTICFVACKLESLLWNSTAQTPDHALTQEW